MHSRDAKNALSRSFVSHHTNSDRSVYLMTRTDRDRLMEALDVLESIEMAAVRLLPPPAKEVKP